MTIDHRGEYGFDGNPIGVLAMVVAAPSLLVLAVLLAHGRHGGFAALALAGAGLLLATLGIYLHTTRRGKFAVWAELLETLQLRGDERVLDVGCGRGAVLTMVAKLLPRGRVVGIDLWSRADQSGNGSDAAERNVALEGVRDRCALVTGDMRAMPFADASFDLVLSSLAVHNILDGAGRARAIDEIALVLKPTGRVAIVDLAWTQVYARQLHERGFSDVRRRRLGWRFWWGLAFPSSSVVLGQRAQGQQ
jgi:SAM-dependent methyltransferase